MTVHELVRAVDETAPYFFSRNTMASFGDTLENFEVTRDPIDLVTSSGETIEVYKLTRKERPANGPDNDWWTKPYYFDAQTFARRFGKED